MPDNVKSYLFISIQFACIGYLLFSGPLFANNSWLFLLEILGIGLAFWAVVSMSQSKLNVLPDVKNGATLIQSGPYKKVRHPMYSALIVIFLTLIVDEFSVVRLLVYLALTVTLVAKQFYEEGLLKKEFGQYKYYQENTWRIIPFVF
ncbi:methyltransferase family protein [Salibacter halophilus]|uniref:Isoprenylcysteine carboxylmethyltransferase family protein n=1 Tax=Salibacter halophilus TaxID=1803916 RepID=A0A6N6M637_9FLAO|nr:isoprenylcysteine carboxylmethyltransferase family protein [Salibacter halophilus]KAB1063722.1 isoprenylcysteine carboxylmethyltransferase family protein [Salibacter halophilus]